MTKQIMQSRRGKGVEITDWYDGMSTAGTSETEQLFTCVQNYHQLCMWAGWISGGLDPRSSACTKVVQPLPCSPGYPTLKNLFCYRLYIIYRQGICGGGGALSGFHLKKIILFWLYERNSLWVYKKKSMPPLS